MEFIFKDIKNEVKNSKTKKKQLKDTLLYAVSKCYNSDFNIEPVVFEPANNLLFDQDADKPEYYIQYTPYTKRVFILKKYGKDEELYDFTVSDFIKGISDEKLISDDSLLEAIIK